MRAKIDDYDWIEIQNLLSQGKTQQELMNLFHISRSVF